MEVDPRVCPEFEALLMSDISLEDLTLSNGSDAPKYLSPGSSSLRTPDHLDTSTCMSPRPFKLKGTKSITSSQRPQTQPDPKHTHQDL